MKPLNLEQFDGHTPGPWTTEFDERGTMYVHSPGAGAMRGNSIWNSRRASQRGNGRLIAAAPALLAECKAQREQIKELAEKAKALLLDLATVEEELISAEMKFGATGAERDEKSRQHRALSAAAAERIPARKDALSAALAKVQS